MENTAHRAVAIVGLGAVLPDAANVPAFWENIKNGRYSVTEVDRDRWDPALYYDPDPNAPDKTYSKIGGWVREFVWDPLEWHLPIPPRVVAGMDGAQKWAVACTREALEDYGYPKRQLHLDRTAVIVGNAMGGEKHYLTAMRIYFPEYAQELSQVSSFAALPESLRKEIARELHDRMAKHLPEVTEDSMPGELSNCIAGRVANLFNFHGPNYVCDAACASAMAAISSAVEGLVANDFDAAITGGIDRNMGASSFVKFCKIGALSATGTRPFAEGADGFVMGEGAALFLMKRLADAERDGDKIYAVLRGMAGSSDGKGKGITAPNPVGQKLAVERAWENAGVSPATATYIEGHGTSTRVGDVVEAQSMAEVLNTYNLPKHSVAIGSVKSNFGHLKAGAGAAGLLKLTLALHNKMIPPSVNCARPNPDIDFAHSPLYVNTELKPWTVPNDGIRCGGLSAFGFGGTNFHAVLEEYIPHRLNGNGKRTLAVKTDVASVGTPVASAHATPVTASLATVETPRPAASSENACFYKVPLRGALVIGAESVNTVAERLRNVIEEAKAGRAPLPCAPAEADLRAPERLAIDYVDAADLAAKGTNALKALAANQPPIWKALRAQGVYRGTRRAGKVAFLYPGQGSQYVNMLKPLLNEPIVAETFAEADRVMKPLLGKALTEFIFVDQGDPDAVAKAEEALKQTAITQPAVLATDFALTRLLAAYGVTPDFAMGHSLGEYGALVAADALPFADALEAVSARGREMTRFSPEDKGLMTAVFAPLEEIERILKTVHGYVVIANVNSEHQSVIGGASPAVRQAMEALVKAGFEVSPLSVSHAFHTSIVASASEPLRRVLQRLHVAPPRLPVVANTNGEFYPTGEDVVPKMLDILAQQVASPVQFIEGLRTLYDAGARVFIEVGPKKALQGFAEDVLGKNGDVISIFTNHPKVGDVPAFNQALCCLYAAGLGKGRTAAKEIPSVAAEVVTHTQKPQPISAVVNGNALTRADEGVTPSTLNAPRGANGDHFVELGRMFAEVLERGWKIYHGDKSAPPTTPVGISGAALGLPGTDHIFDDGNIARLLRGEQFIDSIPSRFRQAMLDKHITRLVKNDNGGTFETISNVADVIKLAGRGGAFDLESEFGISSDRRAALDRDTQLAIAVGLDALRDAGIPLVMRYKTTTKGTQLPDRWMLPVALRDDTGIIFGSAFPGLDSFADEMNRYHSDRARREQLALLESLRSRVGDTTGDATLVQEIDRRMEELCDVLEKTPYVFDRRYLFRVLSMGHSQFAEYIGARGPNTALNAACASTTQAVGIAEDWIRAGRCRRVIVVTADDITTDNLIDWMGAGFLATGAAATDAVIEDAALPFDRRRHGMILGMGAAGIVVESADAARERGIQPICEVLSAVTANSAYHGTRLDVQHISQVMEDLLSKAEASSGIKRHEIASRTVFVSHETYTPARGGSASAEVHALRRVFGDAADKIVIANTKGFTGHAMAAGIEDVLAVKALETGVVPPVANFKEVDPELGTLNLSKGGAYPVEYALRLGAGFGSQISMTLMRWVPTKDGAHRSFNALGYGYRIADQVSWSTWLNRVAGKAAPELEVVRRTLRIHDGGTPVQMIEAAAEKKVVSAPLVLTPVAAVAVPQVAPLTTPPKAAAAIASVSPVTVPVAKPEPVSKAAEGVPISSAAQSISGEQSVKDRILALAVEKTGYPKEMLDFDLDLEADLGVDTVKQAEMFAAIREIYNIPRDENRKLRDYPTLAHVVLFVLEKRPDLASAITTIPLTNAQRLPQSETTREPNKAGEVVTETAVTRTLSSSEGEDPVKERILALAVEKTGYPKDMLDLDLDLEADLGVDTVKQAEMFAAIREIYNIPRDENRKLRDYPTLAHVIRFVHEQRPDLAAASAPSQAKAQAVVIEPEVVITKAEAAIKEVATSVLPPPATPAPTEDAVKERILALAVEKTGYPKDMLDLDLDLEADLGVDTVKQAEMFAAIREIYNIPRDQNRKLRDYPTLGHVIRFVYEQRPDLNAAPASDAQSTSVTAAGAKAVVPETPENSEGNRIVGPAPIVPPIASTGTFSNDSIKDKVLDIAAEKTGYPKEMLDLDLDLEADLGIDTVKQAEMFAAIRAAYNIPRDQNLKLRDFPTLAHVIKFAQDRAPQQQPQPAEVQTFTQAAVSAPPTAEAPKANRPVLASLDAANRVPRRVPVPVLRPPLNLCKQTGVKLEPGTRVAIMPDKSGVADALTEALKAKGVEVLRLEPAADPESFTKLLQTWIASGPMHGVYWLPALDNEGALSTMTPATWHEAVRVRVKSLFTTMRGLLDQIARPGTFLVTATTLGGQHGYDEAGAVAAVGGAVIGFAKTYKRERPETHVKAVDFEADRKPQEIAEVLMEETLRDLGAIEIGYKDDVRWTIGLQEQAAADGHPGMVLDSNSVVVVTGAAGSIVSTIIADLAAASGGTFYLLDLVPEPDPNNPELKRFATDKEGLKRELIARIQARKERATPAQVEKELAAIERAQAAAAAIEAVRAAGGTAHYFRVDLRDAEAVADIIRQVRERSGHIDVLLHAAGMDRSRPLSEKDAREFDLVFDVKADGFFNLLHAIGDMPLKATVAFSSIAGRFGNPGQTDYSSANDLLCKITSSFRTTRPSTRGIAIDWTAWSGIGMASRGSIPKVMEMAGIDMLPPEAGVPIIRRELTCGGTRGEVVIGNRLGVLLKEWDETGGLDVFGSKSESPGRGPMLEKVVKAGIFRPLTIETTLDPKIQPFLYDHQIESIPVLPGVMGIEAFAEASTCMLPGWQIEAVEEVNFLAPFKFYRNQPRTVTVEAVVHPSPAGITADCKLIGRRTMPNQTEPQITTHFTARVCLRRDANRTSNVRPIGRPEGNIVEAAEIYRLYFHGPAYQVVERAWWDGKRMVGLMSGGLPANHQPADLPARIAPRLIELCFQTAGIWEMGIESRMGLPQHIDRVSLLSETPPGARVYAVVLPKTERGFDAEIIDEQGNCYLRLEGYRTVAVPAALDADRVKALHDAMSLEGVAA
jgi:acyl transferase domain-containing protein